MRRNRRAELVRRVGHPPVGAVRRGEELVGVGGRREHAPLEGAGAEREDPLPLERRADLPHQVEVPVEEEAAEHVEPADRPVGLLDVDLERTAAVAGDAVAHVGQRPLQPERLAHHVDGLGVLADVAEVGVAVVPDQLPSAHRAEQRAVGREGVDPGLLQRAEHLLDRVEQRLHVLGAAGVEGLREPQGLVDAQRQATVVDHGDPLLTFPEPDLLVEHDGAAHVLHETEPRRTVQEAAQRRRPGDERTRRRWARRRASARTTRSAGRRTARRGRPRRRPARAPPRRRRAPRRRWWVWTQTGCYGRRRASRSAPPSLFVGCRS